MPLAEEVFLLRISRVVFIILPAFLKFAHRPNTDNIPFSIAPYELSTEVVGRKRPYFWLLLIRREHHLKGKSLVRIRHNVWQ